MLTATSIIIAYLVFLFIFGVAQVTSYTNLRKSPKKSKPISDKYTEMFEGRFSLTIDPTFQEYLEIVDFKYSIKDFPFFKKMNDEREAYIRYLTSTNSFVPFKNTVVLAVSDNPKPDFSLLHEAGHAMLEDESLVGRCFGEKYADFKSPLRFVVSCYYHYHDMDKETDYETCTGPTREFFGECLADLFYLHTGEGDLDTLKSIRSPEKTTDHVHNTYEILSHIYDGSKIANPDKAIEKTFSEMTLYIESNLSTIDKYVRKACLGKNTYLESLCKDE